MLLTEWLDAQGWGSREKLAKKAGVSRMTVRAGEQRDIRRISIARRLSDATEGAVTVDELCPLDVPRKAASGE